MARKKSAARAGKVRARPTRPTASVTAQALLVQFTDGSSSEFAPGALAEFRGRLVVVGRGDEIEAEYQRGLVKGWRYVDRSTTPPATPPPAPPHPHPAGLRVV